LDSTLLIQGIIIGFSIALPVGPIGILCIRKTLAEGRLSGFVVGLGAATADALYGFAAGFGLTFFSNLLISQQMWLRLIGGIFLCYLGVKTFLARPPEKSVDVNSRGLFGSYVSTFLLTLTNPITILAFVGIFTALGIGDGLQYGDALTLVAGVFVGSALWFLLLSGGVVLFREKISHVGLGWVNRISGSLIIVFGVVAILSFR
jgi:threonine/homoserine/homoserine lactone efflux protein